MNAAGGSGGETLPEDATAADERDLIARAKALPDCFLWMCHREPAVPGDLSRYDDLAGCFEAAPTRPPVLRAVADNPG